MATNFDFLKSIDKDSYEIIAQAEKLYQNEFFEPCMAQTRRFGERVCTEVLGSRRNEESTFDDMLATLKDKASSIQEKEFIEDLYFIKKQGNASVHSVKVKSDGMMALECLQRAFEVALNYAVYYKRASSDLMTYQYDTELLVTGEPSINNKSLKSKYKSLKKISKSTTKTSNKSKTNKQNKTKKVKSLKSNTSNLWFKILLILSTSISIGLVILILILSKI